MADNNITTLTSPGNSPDINPIKNLWGIVKKKLRKHDCMTKTELIKTILQIWFQDSGIWKSCENLVDSMPDHVQNVIATQGMS